MEVREICVLDLNKQESVKGTIKDFKHKIFEDEKSNKKDIVEFVLKDTKTKQTIKCQIIKQDSFENIIKKGNLIEVSGKITEDRKIKGEILLKIIAETILLIEEFKEEVEAHRKFRSSINKKAVLIRELLHKFREQKIRKDEFWNEVKEQIPEEITESEFEDIMDKLKREGDYYEPLRGIISIL